MRDFSPKSGFKSGFPISLRSFRAMRAFSAFRMDGFAGRQHRDKCLDFGRPGLGLLGVVYPVKDRVAVSTIQRFEKVARLLVPGQGRLEVVGNLCRALRR